MKKVTSLILIVVLLLTTAAPAYAALPETAVPYYANTSQASVSLVIDENGSASWTIMCIGKSSCVGIDSVTYLERQIDDYWVLVDISNMTDEYTYSTSAARMVQTYDEELGIHGTYRAVVIFTVYGSSEDETITLWSTRTY